MFFFYHGPNFGLQRVIKVAVICCCCSCYFSKQLYRTILSLHFYFRYCSRLRNALMKREELIPEWKCLCAFFVFDLILRLLFMFSVLLAFNILDNFALMLSQIFPSVYFWQSQDKRQDNTPLFVMICDGDLTETAYNLGMGNNCGFLNEWTWTQLKTNCIKDLTPAMVFPHLWWLSSYIWATLGYLLFATMAATAAAQQVNIFTLHLWTRHWITVQIQKKHRGTSTLE